MRVLRQVRSGPTTIRCGRKHDSLLYSTAPRTAQDAGNRTKGSHRCVLRSRAPRGSCALTICVLPPPARRLGPILGAGQLAGRSVAAAARPAALVPARSVTSAPERPPESELTPRLPRRAVRSRPSRWTPVRPSTSSTSSAPSAPPRHGTSTSPSSPACPPSQTASPEPASLSVRPLPPLPPEPRHGEVPSLDPFSPDSPAILPRPQPSTASSSATSSLRHSAARSTRPP